jgi:alcohol-forming fatty acyl-CoA reductase
LIVQAFDRLRQTKPEVLSKVIPICGDIAELNLGMSQDDRRLLEESVSIVMHVAASVKFDDSLTKAVFVNLRATRDILELAKTIKNLKVSL